MSILRGWKSDVARKSYNPVFCGWRRPIPRFRGAVRKIESLRTAAAGVGVRFRSGICQSHLILRPPSAQVILPNGEKVFVNYCPKCGACLTLEEQRKDDLVSVTMMLTQSQYRQVGALAMWGVKSGVVNLWDHRGFVKNSDQLFLELIQRLDVRRFHQQAMLALEAHARPRKKVPVQGEEKPRGRRGRRKS